MSQIEIKSESLPERCEICHQTDCFDPVKNYCSRCAGAIEASQAPAAPPPTNNAPFTPTNWVEGGNEMTSIFNTTEEQVNNRWARGPQPPVSLNLTQGLNDRSRRPAPTRVDIAERPTFRIPPVSGIEPMSDGQLAPLNNNQSSNNQIAQQPQRPHRELQTLFNQQASNQSRFDFARKPENEQWVIIFMVFGIAIVVITFFLLIRFVN